MWAAVVYILTYTCKYVLTNWFPTVETCSGISEDANTLHKTSYYIHYIQQCLVWHSISRRLLQSLRHLHFRAMQSISSENEEWVRRLHNYQKLGCAVEDIEHLEWCFRGGVEGISTQCQPFMTELCTCFQENACNSHSFKAHSCKQPSHAAQRTIDRKCTA